MDTLCSHWLLVSWVDVIRVRLDLVLTSCDLLQTLQSWGCVDK